MTNEDTIRALAGVHHVSIAPRPVGKIEMLEFRVNNLEAVVDGLVRKLSRIKADSQEGE